MCIRGIDEREFLRLVRFGVPLVAVPVSAFRRFTRRGRFRRDGGLDFYGGIDFHRLLRGDLAAVIQTAAHRQQQNKDQYAYEKTVLKNVCKHQDGSFF